MVRGIDRAAIFFAESDRQCFLRRALGEVAAAEAVAVHAYYADDQPRPSPDNAHDRAWGGPADEGPRVPLSSVRQPRLWASRYPVRGALPLVPRRGGPIPPRLSVLYRGQPGARGARCRSWRVPRATAPMPSAHRTRCRPRTAVCGPGRNRRGASCRLPESIRRGARARRADRDPYRDERRVCLGRRAIPAGDRRRARAPDLARPTGATASSGARSGANGPPDLKKKSLSVAIFGPIFACPALIIVPATGGRGFSRTGVPTPLILLGDVGNRHRLKPRPPVPDGLPLAGTMTKAARPYFRYFRS